VVVRLVADEPCMGTSWRLNRDVLTSGYKCVTTLYAGNLTLLVSGVYPVQDPPEDE